MKANDSYQIKCLFINVDLNNELTVLYMPLVGGKAISLYLLLQKEAIYETTKINRLCSLMGTTISEVETSFEHLEQFGLVKTLFNSKTNTYQFNLIKPLSFKEFLENDLFGRFYFQAVGKEQYELTKLLYLKQEDSDSGFVDISKKIDVNMLNSWDENDEESFTKCKVNEKVENNFDYVAFEHLMTNLTFPLILRTPENIDKICQLGTIYNISIEDMAKYVGKHTNYVRKEFDYDGLKKACLNCKRVSENADYQAHPIEFLSSKQKGVPVSSADKRLLEDLMVKFRLPNDLINFLIEYCLNNNKNRLSRSYVEKVATSWIREGIDSLEKAKVNNVSEKAKITYEYKEIETSEQDIDALRKQLFGEEA